MLLLQIKIVLFALHYLAVIEHYTIGMICDSGHLERK